MKIVLYVLFLLLPPIAFASNNHYSLGARSAGMGNASVCQQDLYSLSNNQAGLASLSSIEVGLTSERKFLLSPLNLNAALLALPSKLGVFGIQLQQFGYTAYRDTKYGAAFARSFGEWLSAGMQFNYLETKISDLYGKRSAFTLELGIQCKLSKTIRLGMHLYNPTRMRSAAYNNERIPTTMKIGLNYLISKKVQLALETEKELNSKLLVKIGLEYQIHTQIFIRAGLISTTNSGSFGIGWLVEKVKLDCAVMLHPQLGISPQLGVSMPFSKKKK